MRIEHFLTWSLDEINSLKDSIINEFVKQKKLDKELIQDIIATGSRVYYLQGKEVYNDNSDLDTIIFVKDYDKYFLPIQEWNVSKIYLQQLLNDPLYKDKLRPKVIGFEYKNIRVSIFIKPWKNEYNNFVEGNYYMDLDFPYYSLMQHFYYFGNTKDMISYYIHIKGRIEKYSYCFLCSEWKHAPNTIQFKIYSLEDIEHNNYGRTKTWYLCDKCKKYFL